MDNRIKAAFLLVLATALILVPQLVAYASPISCAGPGC